MSFAFGRIKGYDSGDSALLSSRELLEEIRDKLYAECPDTDPAVLNVKLCEVMDTFQFRDCGNINVGPEEKVLRTIQLAKQIVQICNVQELATAVGNAFSGGYYRHKIEVISFMTNNVWTWTPEVVKASFSVINASNTNIVEIVNGSNSTLITHSPYDFSFEKEIDPTFTFEIFVLGQAKVVCNWTEKI